MLTLTTNVEVVKTINHADRQLNQISTFIQQLNVNVSLTTYKGVKWMLILGWSSKQPNFNVDSTLNQRYVPAGLYKLKKVVGSNNFQRSLLK